MKLLIFLVFKKKQWLKLPKKERLKIHYNISFLSKVKSRILESTSEITWLSYDMHSKFSIIERTILLLKTEFEQQRLLNKKQIEEKIKIDKLREIERIKNEELLKIKDEEQKRLKDEFEKKQKLLELEIQRKLDEEKRILDKIKRQEQLDEEYKNRIKEEFLEKERRLQLEAKAISELQVSGKLSLDYFKNYNRKPIPSHIKEAVWKRDKQKCVYCGSQDELEFDHIIPVSKGGSNSLNNIQLLCLSCNRSKGVKLV
jgi:hypothetical protein